MYQQSEGRQFDVLRASVESAGMQEKLAQMG